MARLLLFGVLHKELLLIYLSKASKIESASNNNFLAALRSFLKQHRKRKKKYYRSTILFFLEMLYSVKSPFYHGYETNFPQSTDLCFQSNQIRMDVRIGYIYWYFHFKDKNTSGQHIYTSSAKIYFYKAPTFLFASHNRTWAKRKCYLVLKQRKLLKANTFNKWKVALFGIFLDHTSLCNYICRLCEHLNQRTKSNYAILSILIFMFNEYNSIIQIYPSLWLNSLFKKNALKYNCSFKEFKRWCTKKKSWSTVSI